MARFSLLAVLVALCVAHNSSSFSITGRASSKDYVNCNSQIGDYVLYNGLAEKSYKVLQKVSLDLPISTSTAIIHCIQAIDIKADGNAASVSVTSGGLNTNYVTLHFESERGHGVHFNVTIRGR